MSSKNNDKKRLLSLSLIKIKILSLFNVILNKFDIELIIYRNSRVYNYDGLSSIHNHDFMYEKTFQDTCNYVANKIGKDYQLWYWRNYIGLRLAEYAAHLPGQFCECGVGDGWMTLSIMKYISENNQPLPSSLWLFDTFEGIDSSLVPDKEQKFWGKSATDKKKEYLDIYGSGENVIRDRFKDFETMGIRINLIKGSVPSSINPAVLQDIGRGGGISFLHIDMNNSVPECGALNIFYKFVCQGGVILFDDYAYAGYEFQKKAIDELCRAINISPPISLPTGQGLIVKSH